MSVIAKRYARAAVSVAIEHGEDEAVRLLEGLDGFADAYATSAKLREVLENPALRAVRIEALRAVMAKLSVSEHALRLLVLLCERERLRLLDEVAAEVKLAVDAALGRVRVHVASAIALSAAQRERLAGAFAAKLSRPVVLDIVIDSSIIGGLLCRVGDITIDSSIRRKLASLRGHLFGAVA